MVIQRSWKILSESGSTSASSTEANRSPTGLNSSSDDSNCSNQTTHSMVTSVASPAATCTKVDVPSVAITSTCAIADTMKFVTTPQMAETTLQKLRQRYNCSSSNSTAAESAMRSLELVRIAVQSSFDKEIDELIKKFVENFFKPAYKNIKENLGQGSVSEDAFQKMSCALLENAKSQYKIYRFKPQNALATVSPQLLSYDSNNLRIAAKRPAPTKPAVAVIEMQKRFFPDEMVIQQPQQQITTIVPSTSQISAVQNSNSSNQQQSNSNTTLQQQKVTSQPTRRQIFWNTAHISTTTKFVLDVQANQAFGFGTDGKERLASKHPELIRYLPDHEDRDWLVSQQIIPQQNRNSRFLFLIYDEVCRLYQTHDIYRSKPNIDLSLMMTFSVADFIIQKMKVFFVDLNIKSRGLIINSYSMTGTNTMQGNSHLRNALLQGTQTATTTVASNHLADNSTMPSTSSSISSSDSSMISKSKSSTLSSSHATLTALLNNPNISEKTLATNLNTSTLLNQLKK
uniref:Uncharacterized protein n=1 Tax=Glossina morsitans morsitans TaxID=37546 RepID=A0A1B0FBZ3_GLOMM